MGVSGTQVHPTTAVSYLPMLVSHVVPGLCVGLICILKSFAEDWLDVLTDLL